MRKIALLLIACLLLSTAVAFACSSFRIATTDGCVFYARTMEDPFPMGEIVTIIPAGTKYTGMLPDGSQGGMKWTTKYGIVGIGALNLPIVCDGMNDAGLAVGMLLYPGYADYMKFDATASANTITQPEVATWLLSTCATVADVRNNIGKISVVKGADDHGGSLPLHYTVHDKSGASIVLEYTQGTLHVFENPFGVMTNSPSFDWHLTNLKNYANLRASNAPPLTINNVQVTGFGQGTGMLGLPGDYTPASRFVRLVALTASSLPVTGADNGLTLAMNIVNNIDIPVGAVRGIEGAPNINTDGNIKSPGTVAVTESGKIVMDRCLWVDIADFSRGRYYYRNYNDMNWRYVDVKQALRVNKTVATIPLYTQGVYIDDTAKAKVLHNANPKFYSFQNP
ncbi:MAG: choloylglycine hydrolase family protein [Negativicutes bacterium]|jgi:choloylglycine hydrolase